MANDSSGKIETKKSKDAAKRNDRPKSLLGRCILTLKDFLTPIWLRESTWQSTNARLNGNEEEVETPSELMTGVKSLLQWFGRTLISFLTPSFIRESSWQSTNPDDNEEGEEPQESLLGRFISTLKDFLLPSWFRESSWQSTNTDDNEEEVETQESLLQRFGRTLISFVTPSFVRNSSWQSTNDNEEGEEPQESLLQWFGRTLIDFITPSFIRESSWHSTNTDPNACEGEEETETTEEETTETTEEETTETTEEETTEEETTEEETTEEETTEEVTTDEETTETTTGVEMGQRDDACTEEPVDGSRIEVLSSDLDELSVIVIRVSLVKDVDFLYLLRIANSSFSATTSEASSPSCTFSGGIRQGCVLEPHLWNLSTALLSSLNGPSSAHHVLYADDLKLILKVPPNFFSNLPLDRSTLERLDRSMLERLNDAFQKYF